MGESLFHYTDIGAVASIIKSNSLWLTHFGFLNDSQELHDGIDKIQKYLDEMDAKKAELDHAHNSALKFVARVFKSHCEHGYERHPLFTCSFSRANNLLSQWRAYGNFAVEFSREKIEADFDLHECIYVEEQKKAMAKDLVTKAVSYMAKGYITQDEEVIDDALKYYFEIVFGAGKFKNKHFESEQEVRIVSGFSGDVSNIMHRARGDCLIPYMVRNFDPSAIRAIHIGPIADQELAERSLKSLLMAYKAEHILLVRSDIPYRSS